MKRKLKDGNFYFIINFDEPYAREIYDLMKRGQIEKGEWPEGDIDFIEYIYRTYSDNFKEVYAAIKKIITVNPENQLNVAELRILITKLYDDGYIEIADTLYSLYEWVKAGSPTILNYYDDDEII